MPQLDLFSIEKKQEPVAPKEKAINSEVSHDNQLKIISGSDGVTEETMVPGTHVASQINQESKPVDSGAVIFADARIRIKLKHIQNGQTRDVVQLETKELKSPDTHNDTIRVAEAKILQKRGRKSFKDIAAEADLIDIPGDDILFCKQYYAISEVAGWFKVNTSLLRFWETEFDILKPRKNRKGDRMFRPEDVKNLQLIHYLLRDKKYTIEGAKEYIRGNKKKADAQLQITQSLQKFKGFLLELKANLQ